MKKALEIDFLDEWIFPETEDPFVGLSLKVVEILASKVKDFNKINPKKRVNINQLKRAFIIGADDSQFRNRELLQSGFDRVNEFLLGKIRDFKKEGFEIRQKSNDTFEIAYAKIEKATKQEEVDVYNLAEYEISSVEELYIEDSERSVIRIDLE